MPESPTVANAPAGRPLAWYALTWAGAVSSVAYLAWSGYTAGHAESPWAWTATAAALLWLSGCLLWLERRARYLRCVVQRQMDHAKYGEHALAETQAEFARHVQQRVDTLNLEIQMRKALDQKLQRTLDDLYQQLASQRDFLAMVSHEFRTPISIIDGARQSLEMLEVGQEPQAAVRLERIRRAVRRMTDLVGGLQAADRLDKDSINLEFARLALGALVSRALVGIVADRPIMPTIKADVIVAGDASLLEIAVANLVSNAVKYGDGAADVRVEVYREDDQACVAVLDRGVGLSELDLTRIFERFYRGANSGNQPGTGLGLFLTQRIVEIHGGTIRAEHRPGGGSIFTLKLPECEPDSRSEPEAQLGSVSRS